jgi:sialic acid synthase
MRQLTIGSTCISDDGDCYVIAEIGHNHQGDLEKCKELFHTAKECGASAVKLQKRENGSLFTREMYEKPYDHENSFGMTYGEHREALEFGWAEYRELQQYAREIGITFFATAFDFASADFLAELDMPAFKIASGDLTNTPLLKYVASFQKPVIVSTGGGSLKDVHRAYDTIMPINEQLCLMQCTSGYPCEFNEMNLRVISTYRTKFPDVVVGLSAHDSGIAMALVAFALGAQVVEKHFTLNRAMKGTDHAFSLERPGLQRLVRDLCRARMALGDGVKRTYESERKPLQKLGKKLVAAREMPAGHVLTPEDIAIKSPGDGLPPYELDRVIGRVTVRPLRADQNISFDDLDGYQWNSENASSKAHRWQTALYEPVS